MNFRASRLSIELSLARFREPDIVDGANDSVIVD